MRRLPSRSVAKAQSHDDAMLLIFLSAMPLSVIGIALFMILALLVR